MVGIFRENFLSLKINESFAQIVNSSKIFVHKVKDTVDKCFFFRSRGLWFQGFIITFVKMICKSTYFHCSAPSTNIDVSEWRILLQYHTRSYKWSARCIFLEKVSSQIYGYSSDFNVSAYINIYIFSYIHILGDIDDHKLHVKELIQNLLVMLYTFCQLFWLLVSSLYKNWIVIYSI